MGSSLLIRTQVVTPMAAAPPIPTAHGEFQSPPAAAGAVLPAPRFLAAALVSIFVASIFVARGFLALREGKHFFATSDGQIALVRE